MDAVFSEAENSENMSEHKQTVSLVKRLGSSLARQTGQEEAETNNHLLHRLAVLLARENFRLMLNRIQTFLPAEINGHD